MCKKDPPREQQKHPTWEKRVQGGQHGCGVQGEIRELWPNAHNSAACPDNQKFTVENNLWHGKLTHLFIQEIFEGLLYARHISNS